jgi:hypothetical protein
MISRMSVVDRTTHTVRCVVGRQEPQHHRRTLPAKSVQQPLGPTPARPPSVHRAGNRHPAHNVVSDVVFLILFIVIGFFLVTRRSDVDDRLATWPPPEHDRIDGSTLTGEELGYLQAGDRRSVEAAIARPRVAGAVTYGPGTRNLVPTGLRVSQPTAPTAAGYHRSPKTCCPTR